MGSNFGRVALGIVVASCARDNGQTRAGGIREGENLFDLSYRASDSCGLDGVERLRVVQLTKFIQAVLKQLRQPFPARAGKILCLHVGLAGSKKTPPGLLQAGSDGFVA
jgi:hypothetical protein